MPAPSTLPPAAEAGLTLAAGGILWDRRGPGRRIAVIHRRRHDDWTLPKGKLEAGESAREAALREVREETGCEAETMGFAGSVAYEVDGRPKVVLFWHMRVTKRSPLEPGEEVDRLVWLRPGKALERLQHAGERALLQAAGAGAGARPGFAAALRRGLGSLLGPLAPWRSGRTERRLDGAIRTFEGELGWRTASSGEGSDGWAGPAEALLGEARSCLQQGRREAAWQALLAAQRLSIFGMTAGERQTHATALAAEAGRKLSGSWRGAAIEEALGDPASAPDAASLWYATMVRDEAGQNEYRKVAALGDQMTSMGLLVGFLLVVLLLLAAREPLPLDPILAGSFEQLVYVVVFGMLGGAVSVMIPRGQEWQDSRIPEQLAQAVFGQLRPLLGAASAVVVFLAFRANLLPEAITGDDAGALILLLAFAAGFSERLVVRAVENVAGKAEAGAGAGAGAVPPSGGGGPPAAPPPSVQRGRAAVLGADIPAEIRRLQDLMAARRRAPAGGGAGQGDPGGSGSPGASGEGEAPAPEAARGAGATENRTGVEKREDA